MDYGKLRFSPTDIQRLRLCSYCDYVPITTMFLLRLRYITFIHYCDLILYRGSTEFTAFSDLWRFSAFYLPQANKETFGGLHPSHPVVLDILGCWVHSLTHSVLYFIIYWSPPWGLKIQRLRLHSLQKVESHIHEHAQSENLKNKGKNKGD